eukprot:431641-Amphidinium_carterae.1
MVSHIKLHILLTYCPYLEGLSSIKLHIDSRNDSECSSWVISDGVYTGGLLWVMDVEGQHPPPIELWRTPADKDLRGTFYDTYHRWVKLPARHLLHGVTK